MEEQTVSLSEKDYLEILGLAKELNECETRSDLNKVIENNLIPLFQASSCLYGWSNDDITSVDVSQFINMPEGVDDALFKDLIAYDPLSPLLAEKNRSVLAHDVDIPRKSLHKKVDELLKDKPKYKQMAKSFFDKYQGALVALDRPNSNLGVALHRLTPIDHSFEVKDIRKMELIRPFLITAIKSIVLSEDLAGYKILVEGTFGSSKASIALIQPDSRIIYHNEVFQKVFSITKDQKLPEELSVLINHEISQLNSPVNLEHSKIDLPIWKFKGKTYRLSLSVLKSKEMRKDGILLIRLESAIEPYSKMNFFMQEAGLTRREMEICTLVKDGIGSKDIALRLFISFYTVKSHLKSIYKKLKVHTRSQLVSLLNQGNKVSE